MQPQNERPLRLFQCCRARRAAAPLRNGRGMVNPAFSLGFATVAGQHDMTEAVLVTGGAGYVGSHACKALAGAGYRPIVYDNLSRGYREAVRWGPLIEGDLHDLPGLAAALRAHKVTAVMHFAALAYVGESMADPAMYYRNKVGRTLAVLFA